MNCYIEDCDKTAKSRDMCPMHYTRWLRHGDPKHVEVVKDGHSSHQNYYLYIGMKKRCYKPYVEGYEKYGGKGVTVCDRWLGKDGFTNFMADMGERPTANHSIDRIDNSGNYTPENCRWATPLQQAHNRDLFSTNTSGYSGVSKHKAGWRARIKLKNKEIHLGVFTDMTEAIKARKEAEKIYWTA